MLLCHKDKSFILKFYQHKRLKLRWENFGIFSQSQPRIYSVKFQYNMFYSLAIKQSFFVLFGEKGR
jgi:hypothetical protein